MLFDIKMNSYSNKKTLTKIRNNHNRITIRI